MGQTRRTAKGDVSIENAEGKIRLRWRYQKERFSLNLPYHFTESNILLATVIATVIKLDMLTGNFDTTLKRYEQTQLSTLLTTLSSTADPEPSVPKLSLLKDLVTPFTEWVTNIKNVNPQCKRSYIPAPGGAAT